MTDKVPESSIPPDSATPRRAPGRSGRDAIPLEAFEALKAIYARLEEAIDGLGLACRGDGACCRFETSGLDLFATGLEIALLVREQGMPDAPLEPGRCPFQEADSCKARAGRPLGCRVYFCDAAAEAELHALYERFHREVRELHARHDLEYTYGELVKLLCHYRDSRLK
jgi:Fe-S-cluster containining protein